MKKAFVLASAFVVLAGLSFMAYSKWPELTRAKAVDLVKKDVLEKLKDPDSAKFRRITADESGSIVCGEVNAKNEMGGYTGYMHFYSVRPQRVIIEKESAYRVGDWFRICSIGADGASYEME